MQITILILSVTVLVCLFFIGRLFNKNNELQKELSSIKESVQDKVKYLEKQIKIQEDLVALEPGDKAILPDYGLTHKKSNESFKVTYEVEIVEVATKKVKVSATDFTSQDTFAIDQKNRPAILAFLQNSWVDRNEIQLVVDEQMRREKKLKQILES